MGSLLTAVRTVRCRYGCALVTGRGPAPRLQADTKDEEDIPCIPDEIYHTHEVAPEDPDYHYQVRGHPEEANRVPNVLFTARVSSLDCCEQGVDIGGGWQRYWDDSHNANYYFQPGLPPPAHRPRSVSAAQRISARHGQ